MLIGKVEYRDVPAYMMRYFDQVVVPRWYLRLRLSLKASREELQSVAVSVLHILIFLVGSGQSNHFSIVVPNEELATVMSVLRAQMFACDACTSHCAHVPQIPKTG